MRGTRQARESPPQKTALVDPFCGQSTTAALPKVFILSEIRLYREGLTMLLSQRGRVQVVAAAPSPDALAAITQLAPDVVLLDASIPDGLALARRICGLDRSIRIVGFALGEVERDVIACAEAGIVAYVTRDGSVEDLIETVDQVLRGQFACSPRLTGLLFQHIAALSLGRVDPSDASRLTRREQEIVPLVEQGLSNKEIARELGIGAATIKNHIHNILDKLHLRRRSEIAARVRRGL